MIINYIHIYNEALWYNKYLIKKQVITIKSNLAILIKMQVLVKIYRKNSKQFDLFKAGKITTFIYL